MNEKKQYKVLHPIGLDGRQERGTVIELTAEVAANYPGLLELYVPEETAIVAPEKAVEEMSLPELVEKATALKLDASGSKADLLERINLALNYQPAEVKSETTSAPVDSTATGESTEVAPPGDASATAPAEQS